MTICRICTAPSDLNLNGLDICSPCYHVVPVEIVNVVTGKINDHQGYDSTNWKAFPAVQKRIDEVKDNYLNDHQSCGIRVGDQVTVTRAVEDYESGWTATWTTDMDSSIGTTLRVVSDDGCDGFQLNDGFAYPHYVLQAASGGCSSGSCGGCRTNPGDQKEEEEETVIHPSCDGKKSCACDKTCTYCKDFNLLNLRCNVHKIRKELNDSCSQFQCACKGTCG